MKRTYVIRNGKMVEKTLQATEVFHQVMPDIKAYQSMVDGSIISSRSRHRDHLRQHNCIEVGNEKMETRLAPPVDTRRAVLREQLSSMTNADANSLLQRLKQESR